MKLLPDPVRSVVQLARNFVPASKPCMLLMYGSVYGKGPVHLPRHSDGNCLYVCYPSIYHFSTPSQITVDR